jgi:Ca2+-binding EF-hand superfamily protein
LLRNRSKQFGGEPDAYLLAKLKPRSVYADKERLFEENLSLKMLNNHLQQENLKLKTRLNQLEREIGRRDDLIEDIRTEGRVFNGGVQKPTHLVTSLKHSVKELRLELQHKEEEVALLKRNLKNTKQGELEVEIQVYVDECTRLRHHLEEMLRQREDTPMYGNEEQQYQQSAYLSNVQKEFEAMTQQLKTAQDEANHWKAKVHDHEKSKRTKRTGEVQGLRSELQKLRGQLELLQEQSSKKLVEYEAALAKQKTATSQAQDTLHKVEGALKERTREVESLRTSVPQATQDRVLKPDRSYTEVAPPPPMERLPPLLHKFFTRLQKVLQRKRMMLAVFLSLMDKNNNGYIEVAELFKGLKQNKAGMKWDDLTEVVRLMGGSTSISIRGVEAWHSKYRFVDDVSSDTSEEDTAVQGRKVDLPVKKQPEAVVLKQPEEAKRPGEVQAKQVEGVRRDRPTSAKPAGLKQEGKSEKQESNLEAIKEESKQPRPPEKKEVLSPKPAEVAKVEAHKPTQPEAPKLPEPKRAAAPPAVKEIPPFIERPKQQDVKTAYPLKKAASAKSSSSSSSSSDDDRVPKKPADDGMSEAEVRPILMHIALRCQLHRLQRHEVAEIAAKAGGKPVLSVSDLRVLLSAQPFALSELEATKLAMYLMRLYGGSSKLTREAPVKQLAKALFEALENWVVLAEEDEERYDRHIAQLIAKNQVSLKEACKLQDSTDSGVVSFKDFKEAIEDLELEFSGNELKYMQLLFYSHNYELDQVPYKQFIKAYSKMQEEDKEDISDEESLDEETRAAIVRDKLDVISRALIQHKLSVVKAFVHNRGLVYPSQLLETLRSLGIPDFDKEEFLVFIEGLQCEEEDELCISLEYLEELLAHYGVQPSNDLPSSSFSVESGPQGILDQLGSGEMLSRGSEESTSHIKKVSMLDSPE